MRRVIRHKFQMMDKQIHDALQVKQYFLNDLRPFSIPIRLAVGEKQRSLLTVQSLPAADYS
jgi:hypothetical protein